MADTYIWRTQMDDRVRPRHADREGKEFAWDDPPLGGHPGEDYNCRCYAETLQPGLDMLTVDQIRGMSVNDILDNMPSVKASLGIR